MAFLSQPAGFWDTKHDPAATNPCAIATFSLMYAAGWLCISLVAADFVMPKFSRSWATATTSVSRTTVSWLLFVVVDPGVPIPLETFCPYPTLHITHVEGVGIHFIQASLVHLAGNLDDVFLLQHLQRPLDMPLTQPRSPSSTRPSQVVMPAAIWW